MRHAVIAPRERHRIIGLPKLQRSLAGTIPGSRHKEAGNEKRSIVRKEMWSSLFMMAYVLYERR